MIISLIQILFWKQTNKKRERGELYIAMKAQAHKKIILLVKDSHFIFVENWNCKVIGDIRDEELEDYKYVVVRVLDFLNPCKANRIEFLKLTQYS